jgi:hypothetical protein
MKINKFHSLAMKIHTHTAMVWFAIQPLALFGKSNIIRIRMNKTCSPTASTHVSHSPEISIFTVVNSHTDCAA